MSKFENLTKYIPKIQKMSMGEWNSVKEIDITKNQPIPMPFVAYSDLAEEFIHDVYKLQEKMELYRYEDILKENGMEWNVESIKNVDVSNLNAQCVLALIMGVVRAERFCDGVLLDFFNSGCIVKWLERLNNIE